MNMIEIFHEYLSELYWEGFAEELSADDPDRYYWELDKFCRIYQ